MSRGRSLYSFCVSFYLLANKIFTSFWFYDTQNLFYTHTHIVWYGVSMQIKWCPNLLFFPVLPLYKKKERKKKRQTNNIFLFWYICKYLVSFLNNFFIFCRILVQTQCQTYAWKTGKRFGTRHYMVASKCQEKYVAMCIWRY